MQVHSSLQRLVIVSSVIEFFTNNSPKSKHLQSWILHLELRRWVKVIPSLSCHSAVRWSVGFTRTTMGNKERPVYVLEQGFTVFLWEGPQSKYFQIFGPSGLSGSCSTLLAVACKHLWITCKQIDVTVSQYNFIYKIRLGISTHCRIITRNLIFTLTIIIYHPTK